MAEVVLDRPRVLAVVGQLIPARVAQHVAVNAEPEAGSLTSTSDHALIPGHRERRQALGNEDVHRACPLGCFPLEPSQRPQLLPAQRMHTRHAALGATDVQLAGGEVDIVPTQRHQLTRPQAMAVGDQDGSCVPMAPAISRPSLSADLVDQSGQIHRLGIELELAGLDLGEVEYLVDGAEQVRVRGIGAAQRLQGLLGTEPCGKAKGKQPTTIQPKFGRTIAYPLAKTIRGTAGEKASKNREEAMIRWPVLASLLLCLVSPVATSAPLTKEIEVNGVRLSYIEEGSGEPLVGVHGAFSDIRIWQALQGDIAKRYRFIAYTQRYFGTGAWADEGKNFGVETHADDLAKLIIALNLGPVHLVTRSYGGGVATTLALKNSSLVRTLTLHEPALLSVLPPDTMEGKAAREDRDKFTSAAMAALKTGDYVQTVRLFFEGVYQLGAGGFDRLPQATQTMFLDNARTAPLQFAAPSGAKITCGALNAFTRPTLITHGDKTHTFYKLIAEGVGKCVPGAQQVAFRGLVHNAPSVDPPAFMSALFGFLAKGQGL